MFKKIIKPKLFIILFLIASTIAISSGILIAIADNYIQDYYHSYKGGTLSATNLTSFTSSPAVNRGTKDITNNSSSNDYFIPTKSVAEWDAFAVAAPGLNVAIVGTPCSGFTYSAWSACNGTTQTRSLTGTSPVQCIVGSPAPSLSQACSCPNSGCLSGQSCRDRSYWNNSTTCAGVYTSVKLM
jgi:hypothetical protein